MPTQPGIYLYRLTVDDESEDRITHKVAPTGVPTWEQIKSQFTETDRNCMMRVTGEIGPMELCERPETRRYHL